MKLVEYPDREMMMMDLANVIAGELEQTLLSEDRASLAVPGGTTPGPMFDSLNGAAHLEWDRIDVMLTDERWVPETSERSNTRLLKSRLLQDQASAATFVPFYTGDDEPDEALAERSQVVAGHLPLSVLLLGMGADMHTASLFPGADKLAEALDPHAPALMPMRAPGAPEPRITLTAPVLTGAISTHLLITGPEKREALNAAARIGDPMVAPVSLVLRNATVHWAE